MGTLITRTLAILGEREMGPALGRWALQHLAYLIQRHTRGNEYKFLFDYAYGLSSISLEEDLAEHLARRLEGDDLLRHDERFSTGLRQRCTPLSEYEYIALAACYAYLSDLGMQDEEILTKLSYVDMFKNAADSRVELREMSELLKEAPDYIISLLPA